MKREPRRRSGRRDLAGLAITAVFLVPVAAPAQDRITLPPVEAAGVTTAAQNGAAQTSNAPTASQQTNTLQSINFTGNTVVSSEALQATAAPYLARPTTADEREDLRQKLTRLYTDLGYVNSGVVWQGDASSGALTGQTMEGRLSAIRLTGIQRLDARYLTRRLAEKGEKGDGPFNIEVLRERFQLALSDPLIERMNARLVPGDQPGEASLEVDVTLARPWQLSVFANNYRAPSIGANAVGASASFRNLTGYGDLLEASYQNAPGSAARGRASLSWNMPLGFASTRLSLALEHGDSAVLEQPAAALDITGQLSSIDVGLNQKIGRAHV